jgi:hypothetical protein
MARPAYPRTYVDTLTGVLHVELQDQSSAMSLHYTTLSNGVRLVY